MLILALIRAYRISVSLYNTNNNNGFLTIRVLAIMYVSSGSLIGAMDTLLSTGRY